MLKTALIYGAIAGSVTIGVMSLGFLLDDGSHGTSSAIFGYTVMLVALSLIFVAVKQHRDRALGGVIKFAPALGLGLAVAAVAAVFYSTGWEIYLSATDYKFIEAYPTMVIAQKEASGASPAEIAEVTAQMDAMMKNYRNPLIRFFMTMTEIIPVGLLVALFSAALLRNPKVLPARA